MDWADRLADEHVAAFNRAVASADFASFLARFADDAVMRFENVPGVGVQEFAGRPAYTSAYELQPPDDQIRRTGPAVVESRAVVVPFAWLRDAAPGVLRLTVRDGRIERMVVIFG